MKFLSLIKSLFRSAPRYSAQACADRVRRGEAMLVDVREPGEWASGFADSAALLPLSDLAGARTHWNKFLAEANGRELLLYCAVGGRSGIAARILTAEGFRAANAGSLAEWRNAGWPLDRNAGKLP
ncbi:MAG: rhodanese-like domain-containing protein [Opitutus sp.]|nr:rhodanese-like domain-containing protein [Opitutus sp.]